VTAERASGSSAARRLVLVVGIGRSGTSLFTGILGKLGFHVPRPEVEADETNPHGFSEPRWVVDLHTRLMQARRVTVFDSRPSAWKSMAEAVESEEAVAELSSWLEVQFVGTENVVVKDPRTGWFLPLWLRSAEDLGVETSFATMLRFPAEVVRSARVSYGTWQNDASRAAAWLNHTLHTELATRGARRVFVRYDDLVADWRREIRRAGELLALPWLAGLERSAHLEVDEFVDPGLRRSSAAWDDVALPAALEVMLDDVWERVSRLAEPAGDDEAARASLDEARAAYVRLYEDAQAITQSSVTAVKPRPQRARTSDRARQSRGRFRPRASWRARALSLVPTEHRERIRVASALGRLGAGGLAALPIRMALLVPPRYRERVPLPVVRAALRLLRSLRR